MVVVAQMGGIDPEPVGGDIPELMTKARGWCGLSGGSNQTRTGVNGFADRYLTTRTWNPFVFECKVNNYFLICKISRRFFYRFFLLGRHSRFK